MPYRLPPYPQLIAHRGASGPYPENTSPAIEEAIALGVDMVEIDVRVCRDGVPILIHHATLEQTTNGKGQVDQHTLAELKQLDAGSWKAPQFAGQTLLTLDEGLELAIGRVDLNLDLKSHRAMSVTLQAVQKMNMTDQVVISGCCWWCVKQVRVREPRLTVLLNLTREMDMLARYGPRALFSAVYLAQARLSPAAGLNLNYRYVNRELVERAHKSGLSIWTWTVDDGDLFQELLTLDVDSITTNWPEQMMPLMERHRNDNSGERLESVWGASGEPI